MNRPRLFYGWVVVGAAHLVLFAIFGVAYSFSSFFGALQTEFAANDLAAASETLKEVTKLWAANELGTRLTAQITAAKNPPKPEPAATPAVADAATVKAGAATPRPKTAGATPVPGKTATAAAATPGAAAVPDTEATTAAASPEEAPKPFFMTVPGAITLVVGLALILAGANIFNKIRQRSSDVQE